MNVTTGAANTLPGYTGYKPAYIQEEADQAQAIAMNQMREENNANQRNRVPGYQGYVPQIKSENVFGATFGCTTKAQKDGNIQAGFDSDAAAKYRSVAQGAYTQQMQAKVHGAVSPQALHGVTSSCRDDYREAAQSKHVWFVQKCL